MTCEVMAVGPRGLRYRCRVPSSTTSAERQRFDRLDALRAVDIVWMAAFHFCYDLNYFRFIHQNFYTNPLWTVQRASIVALFLFCVGLGQAGASPGAGPGDSAGRHLDVRATAGRAQRRPDHPRLE